MITREKSFTFFLQYEKRNISNSDRLKIPPHQKLRTAELKNNTRGREHSRRDNRRPTMAQAVHYACGKCGAELFARDAVLHEGLRGRGADGAGVSAAKTAWGGGACTSVFVDAPPPWLAAAANAGRVSCPACGGRVGSFAWSGAPCSCGRWVTPAFQFQLSKVDPKGLVALPGGSAGGRDGQEDTLECDVVAGGPAEGSFAEHNGAES